MTSSQIAILPSAHLTPKTFVCHDMTKPVLPSSTFDGIASCYAVMPILLERYEGLLQESRPLLKSRGFPDYAWARNIWSNVVTDKSSESSSHFFGLAQE